MVKIINIVTSPDNKQVLCTVVGERISLINAFASSYDNCKELRDIVDTFYLIQSKKREADQSTEPKTERRNDADSSADPGKQK